METPLLQVIIPFAFELGIPRRGESRNTASANEILVTIAQSRVSELFEMFLGNGDERKIRHGMDTIVYCIIIGTMTFKHYIIVVLRVSTSKYRRDLPQKTVHDIDLCQ